jgi:hypothetical protein
LADVDSSTTFKFHPLDPQQAALQERLCELAHQLMFTPLLPGSHNNVPGFVDPLWDPPLMRPVMKPFTAPEIQRLRQMTQLIVSRGTSLLHSFDAVIAPHTHDR